jgi:thioredoxin 1
MTERLLLLLSLTAVIGFAALAVRRYARRRVQQVAGMAVPPAVLDLLGAGSPGIVYFYGPHCPPCRQQAAVLDRLEKESRITVVRVDAARETELAGRFGILTVPATVVLDARGRTRMVNLGLRGREELLAQYRDEQSA